VRTGSRDSERRRRLGGQQRDRTARAFQARSRATSTGEVHRRRPPAASHRGALEPCCLCCHRRGRGGCWRPCSCMAAAKDRGGRKET
jgi:hypothetical protein